ncbi:hypothetical protein GGR52DRAFT_568601 [Hypoxylon sp. FL1284]|nr:hypothetical protein GGR52DRAFT_568601 [Hypoxylon sp. FL1284]
MSDKLSEYQQGPQHNLTTSGGSSERATETVPAQAGQITASLRSAVYMPGLTWKDTICIQYLNGTSKEHAVFESALREIQKYVGIKFEFGRPSNGQPAQLRIEFNNGGTFESFLGKNALKCEAHKATMRLSPGKWDKATSESFIVHELMHFLAFEHEQASPNANIQWDVDRVLQDVKHKCGWNDEVIEANVLCKYDAKDVVASPFDPHSVMIYDIPSSWTLNGFSAQRNQCLSETDKLFLQKAYPRKRRGSSPL